MIDHHRLLNDGRLNERLQVCDLKLGLSREYHQFFQGNNPDRLFNSLQIRVHALITRLNAFSTVLK